MTMIFAKWAFSPGFESHFEQLKSWKCSSYARKHINWSTENFQITPTPSRTQFHDRFNQTETTLGASFIILKISKVNCLQKSSILGLKRHFVQQTLWKTNEKHWNKATKAKIYCRYRGDGTKSFPIDLNTNIFYKIQHLSCALRLLKSIGPSNWSTRNLNKQIKTIYYVAF